VRKFTPSLSVKVTIIFFATGIIFFFGVRAGITHILEAGEVREVLGSYQSGYYRYMLDDIEYPPNIEKAQQVVDRMPFDMKITGDDFEWTSTEKITALGDINFQPFLTLEEDLEAVPYVASVSEVIELARYEDRTYVRIPYGEYVIFLVTPKMSLPSTETYLVESLIGLTLFVLMLCYIGVQLIFRPIKHIEFGANQIGQGNLDYRIAIKQPIPDELGFLAEKINQMAASVEEMILAKQRLNLGVSHELRSPLTRAKLEVELLDDSIIKKDLLNELNAMETIIARLLDSEAINYGHKKLNTESFEINEVLSDLIQSRGFLANRKIKFTPLNQTGEIEADKVLFEVLVKNILENAIRYNPDDQSVSVIIEASPNDYQIKIRDHGPGIPEDELDKITEPFYRTSQSRNRDSGGFGLGLYLCKQIIETHRGSMVIKNHEEQGAIVVLSIPKQHREVNS